MAVLIFTLTIGAAAVLQGGLNRQMVSTWGLPGTVLLNALMFFIAAIIYYGLAKANAISLSSGFAEKASFIHYRWWYVIPGLLGFLFVLGVPFAMAKVGALNVFLLLVLAQILGGFLWDRYVEQIGMGRWQIVAMFFALLSVGSLFLSRGSGGS